MSLVNLLVVERDGPLCTITLNQPERHNVVNPEMLVGLQRRLGELRNDPDLRVVILRGAGDRAFCAGYDLTSVADGWAGSDAESLVESACASFVAFPRPVIAMIAGYAIGGGCELALACDIRVAADTASLRLPIARMGVTYTLDGMQRMFQQLGSGHARYLLFSARLVGAAEAARLGLVDLVVPAGELLAETRRLAGEIAENAPLSIEVTKQVLNRLASGPALTPADEADLRGCISSTFASADAREALAAFREKRPPRFLGK